MHLDIFKFFRNEGSEIYPEHNISPSDYVQWRNQIGEVVATIYKNNHRNRYWIYGKNYSEHQALKIIKMKAFI
jgi:hypothetical protein